MKILSIGSDRKVFEEGSAVRARLLEYGRLAEEIHVIVFAKRSAGFLNESFHPNIFLYPTNSPGRFFHIPFAIMRALKMKRQGVSVDVVTTQDPFEAGVAGCIIARIFKARMHVQIHTDMMSPYFARESVLNRVRVVVAKILLSYTDAVRVVSTRIKKSISKFVRDGVPVTVLPIFVDVARGAETKAAEKKFPQFEKTLLVASRLSREKNIGMAIEALYIVLQKYPAVGLVIVGDGPEFENLKNLVKKRELGKRVIFEGWRENLIPYYQSADMLLLPSNYEGYGMTVVEALSQGCPVVMTDVGCAGDAVKSAENGLVVPVGSVEALAGAIEAVISGEAKLEPKTPNLPTKEEYLAMYKKSWEDALL